MKNIGYLGLGIMGNGMTCNLIQKCPKDTTIWGYDPVEACRERFAQNGGRVASDAHELYTACDAIFFCLPTNALVRATIEDILANGRPGTYIVDMGASSPFLIREMHEKAAALGFPLIDAPVSGGQSGAEAGTLTIMCGGREEDFQAVRPYLEMMGTTVTYMGGPGCGDATKIANNMMVGIHLCALGEAAAFATKAGIDLDRLFAAIMGGSAQSWVMDQKASKLLSRDYSASARMAVHLKDINNAMELAGSLNVDLPLTEIVLREMNYVKNRGLVDEDHCAVVKYYEDRMGVTVGGAEAKSE